VSNNPIIIKKSLVEAVTARQDSFSFNSPLVSLCLPFFLPSALFLRIDPTVKGGWRVLHS
jgi:hypothetical protein